MSNFLVIPYYNPFQEQILRRGGRPAIHDFGSTGFMVEEAVRAPEEPIGSDPVLDETFLRSLEEARATYRAGLSSFEEAVDRHLKTREHHDHSRVSDDICAVCHDSLLQEDREKIAALDCGHDFHAGCIKPWLLLRKNCCPLCRATVIRQH